MLLATGDDDGESESATTTAEDPAALTQLISDERSGLKVQYPAGWKRSESEGITNLESPDRCVVIALSAPAAASAAGRLFEDTIGGLRRNFGKLRTRPPTGEADIGSAPTQTRLAAVRTKSGQSVVIQVSVSKGKELAHVTQVVIRDPGCAASLQQSGAVVGSIEYRR